MLDHENLKWIATTSTELNSTLQQISRFADLARQHKGEETYLENLSERVELASKTAQALFDRVTSSIMTASVARPPERERPRFSVVPAPSAQATRKTAPVAVSRAIVVPAATDTPPPEFEVRNPGGTRELILLVDDEMEIAELAAAMLADEGYRIIVAKDGMTALEIYRHIGATIGLVILDFFLPVLDGDAVFEELQAINPDVNVVLSSGFAEQTKLGGMLSRGLRGFIPKPYTRQKLLAQVRMTLEAAREAIA
jgi:CheY-like chemotaxis protein